MHMMFVDESGDPGYPQSSKWNSWGGSTLFVRVGVIIHGWKWKGWNQRLKSFKETKGLAWNSEIKASHIRRGKEAFSGMGPAARKSLRDDLLNLIKSATDITLIGVIIDKRLVDTQKGDRMVKPQVRSLELLLERYNLFLNQQQDKGGIVILDSVKEHDDDNLRYFQAYLQAFSQHLQPPRIVESTFFVKSDSSNMIQIADVCANTLYRNENGTAESSSEFKIIYPRFWRHNNRVQGYGIKKWPPIKKGS